MLSGPVARPPYRVHQQIEFFYTICAKLLTPGIRLKGPGREDQGLRFSPHRLGASGGGL